MDVVDVSIYAQINLPIITEGETLSIQNMPDKRIDFDEVEGNEK